MPASALKKRASLPPAAQQSSSSSSSRKRKADSDKNAQKFYAVRSGVRPGVYLTWTECQAQIAGFRGAQCKPA